MNTRIVKPAFNASIAALAALLATAGTPAAAAGLGGALQPGSTVCTDWLRTDGGGVYLIGNATGTGVYTWSMLVSSAPGAAEIELVRAVGNSITRHVVPPVTGRFFYRNCLSVATRPATGYRLVVSQGVRSINPVYGIGPHTARLTPGSSACGEFAMAPTLLRGDSDRAVQWSVRGTDLDYSPVGGIFSVVGPTVEQSLDLPSWLSSLDACATNNAQAPATVEFDFLDP